MPKSIAQLAEALTAAQTAAAAGDRDAAQEAIRICGELHNHPSTAAARRSIVGAAANVNRSAKRGDKR
ncbi:hypothetical protein AB0B88_16150 [Micromonospora haikouensis]|uniref:hypothetical protein n=1 Tax=Micromonospora haikouensis TaxID=686309 RepID=UPI0033DF1CA8